MVSRQNMPMRQGDRAREAERVARVPGVLARVRGGIGKERGVIILAVSG